MQLTGRNPRLHSRRSAAKSSKDTRGQPNSEASSVDDSAVLADQELEEDLLVESADLAADSTDLEDDLSDSVSISSLELNPPCAQLSDSDEEVSGHSDSAADTESSSQPEGPSDTARLHGSLNQDFTDSSGADTVSKDESEGASTSGTGAADVDELQGQAAKLRTHMG